MNALDIQFENVLFPHEHLGSLNLSWLRACIFQVKNYFIKPPNLQNNPGGFAPLPPAYILFDPYGHP